MNKEPVCDFCGRPGTKSRDQNLAPQRLLELDEDSLWVCGECKTRLVSRPIGNLDEQDSELDAQVKALIGKSAGAICRTLHLPYQPPYQTIIDAASKIAYDENRFMSAWSFVTLWMDGTTVWQSEDLSAKALVSPDGNIQIETRV